MRFRILLTSLLLACSASPSLADRIDPVRMAISGYIQPHFERFAEEADLLAISMEDLCAEPDDARLEGARGTFRSALMAWSRVEFIRTGPLTEEDRLERLLFWPDRRGRALRQVHQALARRDATVLDQATLTRKSVAVQGFGALEYLLFGTGAEELVAGDVFRCGFAAAVAENINSLAGELVTAWWDAEGFARTWTTPGAENDFFRDDTEALAELVGILALSMEIIRDQKLLPLTRDNQVPPNHRKAIFWRSGMTVPVVTAGLAGLSTLSDISGIALQLPRDEQWVGGSMVFEFTNAQRTLAKLDQPIAEIVVDSDRLDDINYLAIVCRSLQRLFGEQMASAFGLATGFSPTDGD